MIKITNTTTNKNGTFTGNIATVSSMDDTEAAIEKFKAKGFPVGEIKFIEISDAGTALDKAAKKLVAQDNARGYCGCGKLVGNCDGNSPYCG